MSLRSELIRFFGAHDCADIGDVPEYQALLATHGKKRPFQEEHELVRSSKQRLEAKMRDGLTHAGQVSAALTILHKSEDRRLDVYHGLIVAAYKPEWSAAQQEYFEDARRKLRSRHDYFLSFTMRYPPGVGNNPINDRYKYFIRSELSKEVIRDGGKENLLAKAVHRRLLSGGDLDGFIFTDHAGDNTDTEKKLRKECADSLVLVQLLQPIMFTRPGGVKRNYCFFEYCEMTGCLGQNPGLGDDPDKKQRVLFLLAADSRDTIADTILVDEEYEAWHDHVQKVDFPVLGEIETYDPRNLDDLRAQVDDKILPRIRAVRRSIIQGVPE